MPKARRKRKPNFQRVQKKNRPRKDALVLAIRDCAEDYETVFVFVGNSLRGDIMMRLRNEYKFDSRFIMGKKTLMSVGFGRDEEESIRPEMWKLTEYLIGEAGVLFTNRKKEDVIQYFKEFRKEGFARAGFTATESFEVKQGPLPQFGHATEPYLRKLGLPTELKQGIILVRYDYTVCQKGDVLSPEAANLLKLFGVKMADFRIQLVCVWSNNKFELLVEDEDEVDEVEERNDTEDDVAKNDGAKDDGAKKENDTSKEHKNAKAREN